MEIPLNQHYLLVLLSAAALPALALVALFLRRGMFTGRLKTVFLVMGTGLLLYATYATFTEHGDELGWGDVAIGGMTALLTVYLLSRFSHGHTHEREIEGARGIVIVEAFHSLIDGAVIGATYLVSPLLGYAATVGIIVHELPKIFGTLAIFRSLGLSIRKTIVYGVAAQIGSPVAAILVYMLGKRIDHEQFHMLEIASVSSLAAIVLWIMYQEWSFHRRHPKSEHSHTGSAHEH